MACQIWMNGPQGARDCGSALQHLPSKCKTLGSILSINRLVHIVSSKKIPLKPKRIKQCLEKIILRQLYIHLKMKLDLSLYFLLKGEVNMKWIYT